MKRRDFLAHLQPHGCELRRQGGRYTVFYNPSTNRISTVPRHKELHEFLARKICRDLGIPPPS
jgi:mRNA interferase HicA